MKEGIFEGKAQKAQIKEMEKKIDMMTGEDQYFPFTHGDNIER